MRALPGARALWATGGAATLSACDGPQSTLAPAGVGADRIATLFWWMAGGAAVIWLAVVALALYGGLRARESVLDVQAARRLILWGGAVFPTVVITGLLGYGLALLPEFTARSPEGALRVAVTGEQWWWRMLYRPAQGPPVPVANELWLPVGEPVEFELDSPDVIHSFWIPALGGKMDMIPGRRTRLVLEPTREGSFRGVCAEYCGASHALMGFAVRVVSRDEFERWLQQQALPARPPSEPLALRGADLFHASGCGACHTVRGTEADGVVGPDLTHVGGRQTLAAAVLPNTREAFRRWLSATHALKPEARMPSFGMLPPEELEALAAYLEGLR